jgi:hypothetical protein
MVTITSYAQIKYESGYFINNEGQKTNCLIRNMDWKENPTGFSYKLSPEATARTLTVDSVMEFGIYNESKFKRFTVDIDRSVDGIDLNSMGTDKEPKFKKETLFLKPLIESKASLYYYEGGNIIRYFFTVDNSNVKQLVYKQYQDAETSIKKNNEYKTQLWTNLQCPQLTMGDIESTEYQTEDLVKIFNIYNQANGAVPIINGGNKSVKRDWFNLNIRPGIVRSSLETYSMNLGSNSNIYADFGTKETFRFGAEAEFILPFNKNKWSFFIEPTYRDYKSTYSTVINPLLNRNTDTYDINYQTIEVPFGVRHYLFLNDHSKLFVNLSYTVHFFVGAYYKVDGQNYPGDLNPTNSYQLGFGYSYKKFSIETRFEPSKEIINYSFWTSSIYKNFSVIFGYNLF